MALTRYGPLAASSRLRHFIFAEPLAARGYDLSFVPFFDDRYVTSLYGGPRFPAWRIGAAFLHRARILLSEARRADLLWIEKELFPRGGGLLDVRWLPRDVPIIVDFDDDWMARYAEIRPGILTEGLRRIFAPLLDRAARVTCSNEVLAERLASLTKTPIAIVRGSIDTTPYQTAVAKLNCEPTSPPCVGWIGNPMTAARYLEPLVPMLNALQEAGVCRVRLIGAGGAVRQLRAERLDWSIDSEAMDVAGIDIGLMPLSRDAFTRGKSGFKLLQYMAASRPFVTTLTDGIRPLVCTSGAGLTASDPETWRQAIATLCADANRRAEMGAAGYAYVLQHHSSERIAQEIAAGFNIALSRPESSSKT